MPASTALTPSNVRLAAPSLFKRGWGSGTPFAPLQRILFGTGLFGRKGYARLTVTVFSSV